MAERQFTRDQARALLPRLRPLLEALQRSEGVATDVERRRRLGRVARSNGGGEAADEITGAVAEVAGALAQLEELGVVVRDPSSGLVDFPAERDGQPVYLCWRLGEDDVAHWHPRDEGFAGRQPL